MNPEDTLHALRAALDVTPDNVPLRRHVAELLVGLRRLDEAEVELRTALRVAPDDVELRLLLASCYRGQGKLSAALVVLDDLIDKDLDIVRARLERARTRLRLGDVEGAVRDYRAALDDDPTAADPELAMGLGIGDDGAVDDDDPRELVDGRLRRAVDEQAGGPELLPIDPGIDFSAVGGMEDLKDEIRRRIVHPLQHPELYRAYGKAAGGGILLYGPPGCGKTHLARATAGEVSATFLSIGIHDVLDMWIGQSERNLHRIFEVARDSTPCVLFFDEVDALGASRSDLKHHAGRQTINQFLAELDGLSGDNDGLLVLAATNAPWHMDSAFRRPGRFDRVLFVPPPDAPARAAILGVLLEDKPQRDVDREAVAKRTEGFSGADLKAVVDSAVDDAIAEAIRRGRPEPITTKALLSAAKRLRPTTREWFQSARNYVLYANEGGLYDDLKEYLRL
ncbi:MAG: AAA family ATPase [Planctomycetes bacterium]|nr:AAA family ATPase [Planctomycetota bacterium]